MIVPANIIKNVPKLRSDVDRDLIVFNAWGTNAPVVKKAEINPIVATVSMFK